MKYENVCDEDLYSMAELFKNFSDLTRVKILNFLMEKEANVGEIAVALSMSPSSISHQLRVLKQARLIKYQKEGKHIYYSLKDEHVLQIMATALEHVRE